MAKVWNQELVGKSDFQQHWPIIKSSAHNPVQIF
jgi:hypothetical protein